MIVLYHFNFLFEYTRTRIHVYKQQNTHTYIHIYGERERKCYESHGLYNIIFDHYYNHYRNTICLLVLIRVCYSYTVLLEIRRYHKLFVIELIFFNGKTCGSLTIFIVKTKKLKRYQKQPVVHIYRYIYKCEKSKVFYARKKKRPNRIKELNVFSYDIMLLIYFSNYFISRCTLYDLYVRCIVCIMYCSSYNTEIVYLWNLEKNRNCINSYNAVEHSSKMVWYRTHEFNFTNNVYNDHSIISSTDILRVNTVYSYLQIQTVRQNQINRRRHL